MLTRAELLRLRSLRDKKHRDAEGVFVIEGEKVIGELIASGYPLLEVYATPSWSGSPTPLVPATRLVKITAAEMERASHFPTPSTVLAIGRIQRPRLELEALDHGLTLALDGVQDAGNVGTLIRIADWFGLKQVLLSPDCADVFHQKVLNASMGSFARVPAFVADLASTFAGLKSGLPVLGCDLTGTDVRTLRPIVNGIIVVGNEGRGLSAAVSARISQHVTIPRRGRAESLNAAVAAGIVCSHLTAPA